MKNIQDSIQRFFQTFSENKKKIRCNFLLITTNNLICQSQIFPFYFFRKKIYQELGISFQEIDISSYLANAHTTISREPDVILFQPWFDYEKVKLKEILEDMRSRHPASRIVFLDSYAPVDLRFAEVTNPYIDLYVKKTVFKDKKKYAIPTSGDTNLVDFYGKLYGLEYSESYTNIPSDFFGKLVLGTNFEASSRILPIVRRAMPPTSKRRDIDVHARLGGAGKDWYGRMREHAIKSTLDLNGLSVLNGPSVKYKKYIEELNRSKICFSPFGYGEVCWRDYEATIGGALLVKPNMDHIETRMSVFVKNENYVSIEWDFSNLSEVLDLYINSTERIRIVENAQALLQENIQLDNFLSYIREIMYKLKLN